MKMKWAKNWTNHGELSEMLWRISSRMHLSGASWLLILDHSLFFVIAILAWMQPIFHCLSGFAVSIIIFRFFRLEIENQFIEYFLATFIFFLDWFFWLVCCSLNVLLLILPVLCESRFAVSAVSIYTLIGCFKCGSHIGLGYVNYVVLGRNFLEGLFLALVRWRCGNNWQGWDEEKEWETAIGKLQSLKAPTMEVWFSDWTAEFLKLLKIYINIRKSDL